MKSRISFENGSMEGVLTDQLSGFSTKLQDQITTAEQYVRREPRKAMMWAILAGYVLRILPVTAILAAFVRAFSATLKPAALLFGAVKVFDMIQAPKTSSPRQNG